MKKNTEKTNVMRVLEQKKIPYTSYCYADTGVISGKEVAFVLGQDPARVFKTLVTVGSAGSPYVFLVPVEEHPNAEIQGAFGAYGLYSWRLFPHRDEKAVPHGYPRVCDGSRHDYFQRRENRLPGGNFPGGDEKGIAL